jgi:hypothetical protein
VVHLRPLTNVHPLHAAVTVRTRREYDFASLSSTQPLSIGKRLASVVWTSHGGFRCPAPQAGAVGSKAINQAWLACVTLAADLTAWLRLLVLPDTSRRASPKPCATGYYTYPPGSPEAADDDICDSRNPGPGPPQPWTPSPE